jgi:hypothetical protein
MPRLEVPLLGKRLRATGDLLLRAELDLLIRTNAQTWEQVVFLVDSGTEITTMPAARARLLDLPLPARPVPGLTHGPTGLEVRAGVLRAQVVGLGGPEYVFPCYFLGDPNQPVSTGQAAQVSRNLLGLTGVVGQGPDRFRRPRSGRRRAPRELGNRNPVRDQVDLYGNANAKQRPASEGDRSAARMAADKGGQRGQDKGGQRGQTKGP